MKGIKLLKLIGTAFMSIIVLSACSSMSSTSGSGMADGNNAFGVPPSAWNKLSPAEQRSIIYSHMGIRRHSAKRSKTQTKAKASRQADNIYPQKQPPHADAKTTETR